MAVVHMFRPSNCSCTGTVPTFQAKYVIALPRIRTPQEIVQAWHSETCIPSNLSEPKRGWDLCSKSGYCSMQPDNAVL
jgi:hypothetical protein